MGRVYMLDSIWHQTLLDQLEEVYGVLVKFRTPEKS